MHTAQPAILLDVPARSRYLTFVIDHPDELKNVLMSLTHLVDGNNVVMGIGANIAKTLNKDVPGLHQFPALSEASVPIPVTPGDLWFWLRGDDLGELLHRGRAIGVIAKPAFKLISAVDGFKYGSGLDLTGYVDGTENPADELAEQAALVSGVSNKMDGSSFVAVQQWQHDLNYFENQSCQMQDHIIGRTKLTDEEIDDAPLTAHVKRVEQDDFDPPAYVVRRSMPWIENQQAGLMFVSFGHLFDAFEKQLRRMVGLDDAITDALFTFSKPLTGNFYWCPPIGKDGIDLSQLIS